MVAPNICYLFAESYPSPAKQAEPSTSKIVLHDSLSDDDLIDSEIEPYDNAHDTVKDDTQKPTYIRACLVDLIATNKVP